MAGCGTATSRPWALTGLWSTGVVYGGCKFTVHGPKAGSMVDQVHLSPLSLWFTCTGCMGMLPARGGVSLVSYRGGAPAGGELAVRLRGGAGDELGRGKAFPGHGDCVGGVKVAARASPRCWPRRAAARAPPACGNGMGLRHRPVLWCAWATQRPNGHVGQVEGSSRASGGYGHGGALPSSTAVSVRCLWSW